MKDIKGNEAAERKNRPLALEQIITDLLACDFKELEYSMKRTAFQTMINRQPPSLKRRS